MLSFKNYREDFSFDLNYGDVASLISADELASFGPLNVSTHNLSAVAAAFEGHADDVDKGVKVHFRIDESGIVHVDRAEAVFEREPEAEPTLLESISDKFTGWFGGGDEDDENATASENATANANATAGEEGEESDQSDTKDPGDAESEKDDGDDATSEKDDGADDTTSTDEEDTSDQDKSTDEKDTADEEASMDGDATDEDTSSSDETDAADEDTDAESDSADATPEDSNAADADKADGAETNATSDDGGNNTTDNTTQANKATGKDTGKDTGKVTVSDEGVKMIVLKEPIKRTSSSADIVDPSVAFIAAAKGRVQALKAAEIERKSREEALNTLETLIYKAKDLLEEEDVIAVSTEEQREGMMANLTSESEWLEEDGWEANTSTLNRHISTVENTIKDVTFRSVELHARPEAVKRIESSLNYSLDFVEKAKNFTANLGENDTAWHTEKEINDLLDMRNETELWLAEKIAEQDKLEAWEKPALTSAKINMKADRLDREVYYLVKKPKPRAKKPKKAKKDKVNITDVDGNGTKIVINATDDDAATNETESDKVEVDDQASADDTPVDVETQEQAPDAATDADASRAEADAKGGADVEGSADDAAAPETLALDPADGPEEKTTEEAPKVAKKKKKEKKDKKAKKNAKEKKDTGDKTEKSKGEKKKKSKGSRKYHKKETDEL